MRQFLVTIAGVFVGLFLFFVVLPLVFIMGAAASSAPSTPARTVLTLDLRNGLSDQSHPAFFNIGGGDSVMSVIQALHRAERDDRVKGLLIRLPESGMDPASADELRLAIQRFRAAGKRVLVHSQGVYPGGAVASTYELAAASGEIWMQPGASFQVTGMISEEIFFQRFFERYGIQPDFQQRQEYKNAVNPFLHADYTPEHREATLSWMTSIYESAIGAAARDRRRDAAELRRVLEAGPYVAEEAHRLRLIDRLGGVREAEQALLTAAGDGARLVEIGEYEGPAQTSGATIAVIAAEGDIVTGRGGGGNPFSGSSSIYSDDVAAAFYRAIEDNDVRAIVFRVSSPGGSDTASEQILAAVRAAKAAGKPVVVSMGSYAASGGYWISSEASAIVAHPTTLTGSIGVFGGKFAIGQALARFGVDVRPIGVGGDYAQGMGAGAPMTESQRAAFSRWIDRVYEGFLQRVARGRNLPVERVREIARGRVWTGQQALGLRLVDETGGFYQAVERARVLARINGDVRLRDFTAPSNPFEQLARMFGAGAEGVRALGVIVEISRDPDARAVLRRVQEARAHAGPEGTVLAPTPVLAR